MNNIDVQTEEHLDFMIRLACQELGNKELEEFIAKSNQTHTSEDEKIAKSAYDLYQKKLTTFERRVRVAKRRHTTRCIFSRVLGIAACLTIALAIAMPFALANISAFRVRVLRMLVRIEADYTNIGLVDDITNSFDVPAEWQGEYFPSYIPEGYEVSTISRQTPYVKFINYEDSEISFEECAVSDKINIDNENTTFAYEIINGMQLFIAEHSDSISATWSDGRKLFIVHAELSREELLKVIKNVRYIK